MTRRIQNLVFATAFALVALAACGGPTVSPAMDGTSPALPIAARPPIYVRIAPNALRRDAVFGPFVDGLFRKASVDLPASTGAAALRGVWTRADAVILTRASDGDHGALLLEGVPGDVDPALLGAERGERLFTPAPPLVVGASAYPRFSSENGLLTVYPGRTWLLGDATDPRTLPPVDGQLLTVLLDGPTLTRKVPRLRIGPLAPLGDGLRSVSITLGDAPAGTLANGRALGAVFAYANAERAASASDVLLRAIAAFRGHGGGLAFLAAARVSSAADQVVVQLVVDGSALRGVEGANGPAPSD